MAPHNEEDDPAVYRAGTYKKSAVLNGTNGTTNTFSSDEVVAPTNGVNGHGHGSPSNGEDHRDGSDEIEDDQEGMEPPEEDDEEDSTLLTVQPGFNRLLLVLRDERVMRFVKYVSAAADGSRWDVCAEYEVGVVQEEEPMEED